MLIGLGGYAKSGKDATADFMVEDAGFTKRFFSWAVNEALLVLNPWLPYAHEVADVWPANADMLRYADFFVLCGGYAEYEHFKDHPVVRQYMQDMGTGVGRKMFGENVWVDKLDQQVREHGDVVVTGVRYQNELEWVRSSGGKAIWVARRGYGPINAHSSDNSLGEADFDAILQNDGTLDDLRARAKGLVA